MRAKSLCGDRDGSFFCFAPARHGLFELVGELGTSFLCLSASTRSPSLGGPDGEISSGGTLRPAVGEGLPSVQTARLTIGEA